MPETEWMSRAACRNLPREAFFPASEAAHRPTPAMREVLAVCRRCPVLVDCRRYIDEVEHTDGEMSFGIWAGETPRQRRRRRQGRTRRRTALHRALEGGLHRGCTPRELAEAFGVSIRTVERCRDRMSDRGAA